MFWITIFGAPKEEIGKQLWQEIEPFKVNFTILDKSSYIYGEAEDKVIAEIIEKVKGLDIPIKVERW